MDMSFLPCVDDRLLNPIKPRLKRIEPGIALGKASLNRIAYSLAQPVANLGP